MVFFSLSFFLGSLLLLPEGFVLRLRNFIWAPKLQGEVFEGNYADTCAEKFPPMLMGDEQSVKRAQTVSKDPISVSGIQERI